MKILIGSAIRHVFMKKMITILLRYLLDMGKLLKTVPFLASQSPTPDILICGRWATTK